MSAEEDALVALLAAHEIERGWPYRCECGAYDHEAQTENEHLAAMLLVSGWTRPSPPATNPGGAEGSRGLGWWVISGEDFQEALRRVHAGEDPEMVYAEWYANSEVETDA